MAVVLLFCILFVLLFGSEAFFTVLQGLFALFAVLLLVGGALLLLATFVGAL